MRFMKKNEVEARVEAIRMCAGDPESAHGMEDDLYVEILQLAAEGHDVQEIAAIALKVQEMDFARWYA